MSGTWVIWWWSKTNSNMKPKVVQHVPRIIFHVFKVFRFSSFQKIPGSQRLSDFQTFFQFQSLIFNLVGCLREDNVDYYGSDITGYPKPIVTGPAACNNLCVQNVACTHWSFGKDNKKCYLKNSDSGKNKHNNRISGPQCSTGKKIFS